MRGTIALSLRGAAAAGAALLLAPGPAAAAAAARITVDATVRHQTIVGWEAESQSALYDSPYQVAQSHRWKDEVVRLNVEEVGVNRIKLGMYSGTENPTDWFAGYLNDLNYTTWRQNWYEAINDDANPSAKTAAGFQFTVLDHQMDRIVVPARSALRKQGEDLYLTLNPICFLTKKTSGASTFLHSGSVDEYAEWILAAFQHFDGKYGFVPDAVEIVLEPDNAPGWDGPKVGQAMVAAGARLAAAGFTPDFIGPSTSSVRGANYHFDGMIQVSGVTDWLTEFSYHRYSSQPSIATDLQALAQRAKDNGVGAAMLEWWDAGNSYRTLHEDLKDGGNVAWSGGPMAYTNAGGGTEHVTVTAPADQSVPSPATIPDPSPRLTNFAKYVRQYFLFVREGAVRVGASTDDSSADPLAFENRDGGHVVVVRCDGARDLTIEGLPAGTYGIKYTTGDGRSAPVEYDVDLPDVTIAGGATLAAAMPGAGVVTVHRRKIDPPVPPGATIQVDPAAAPPTFTLEGMESSAGKLWVEFSTDPAFAASVVRLLVPKPNRTTFRPSRRGWRKALRQGADGTRIYARVVAPRNALSAAVAEILVNAPVAPSLAVPVDDVMIDVGRPTFEFDAGGAKSAWLEFAGPGPFDLPLVRLAAPKSPRRLTADEWRTVRKALDRADALGTAAWRVVGRDVLRRTAASAPRAFHYVPR